MQLEVERAQPDLGARRVDEQAEAAEAGEAPIPERAHRVGEGRHEEGSGHDQGHGQRCRRHQQRLAAPARARQHRQQHQQWRELDRGPRADQAAGEECPPFTRRPELPGHQSGERRQDRQGVDLAVVAGVEREGGAERDQAGGG
jgi:hypothetical protein